MGTRGTRPSDFRIGIIRQFHHVVEVALGVVTADLEDVNKAFVAARERLEFLDAIELTLVGTGIGEAIAEDDLHRAPGADGGAGEPDIAIAAAANAPDQFVIGHGW